jgi:hypothetical protein
MMIGDMPRTERETEAAGIYIIYKGIDKSSRRAETGDNTGKDIAEMKCGSAATARDRPMGRG